MRSGLSNLGEDSEASLPAGRPCIQERKTAFGSSQRDGIIRKLELSCSSHLLMQAISAVSSHATFGFQRSTSLSFRHNTLRPHQYDHSITMASPRRPPVRRLSTFREPACIIGREASADISRIFVLGFDATYQALWPHNGRYF